MGAALPKKKSRASKGYLTHTMREFRMWRRWAVESMKRQINALNKNHIVSNVFVEVMDLRKEQHHEGMQRGDGGTL
jgi:hypothetical protein